MSLPPAQWIDLPTGRASFLDTGPGHAGDPVLLLHGGGIDRALLSWRLLFPELAATHRVIAPDWPGYGGSVAFGRPYRISDLGAWLTAFMDATGIARAAMVGVSMGGGAALWMALHRPDRVTRIVPVATYGIADRAPLHELTWLLARTPLNRWSFDLLRQRPGQLKKALSRIFKDPGRITPALLGEVAAVLDEGADGQVFANFMRGETRRSHLVTALSREVAAIANPTLFIHGDADRLVPVAAVKQAASTMPNARIEIMSAGHWPMRECPEPFNGLVTRFLAQ